MKLFVISDIHGSLTQLKKALNQFDKLQADKLILLGDLYYHGPRNKLPEGYDSMGCANLLNQYEDKIIAIKGNCDAEVDEMISKFKFQTSCELNFNSKKLYFTHGHHEIENMDNYDVIFVGHSHIYRCEKINSTLIVNPGSISLPKADNSSNYLVVENNTISFYDINSNKLINKINF